MTEKSQGFPQVLTEFEEMGKNLLLSHGTVVREQRFFLFRH
jgi:hypothetical protein